MEINDFIVGSVSSSISETKWAAIIIHGDILNIQNITDSEIIYKVKLFLFMGVTISSFFPLLCC